MTPLEYWSTRETFFRNERRISLAMARRTGDRRWVLQARTELTRELEAAAAANAERDLEKALFAA